MDLKAKELQFSAKETMQRVGVLGRVDRTDGQNTEMCCPAAEISVH